MTGGVSCLAHESSRFLLLVVPLVPFGGGPLSARVIDAIKIGIAVVRGMPSHVCTRPVGACDHVVRTARAGVEDSPHLVVHEEIVRPLVHAVRVQQRLQNVASRTKCAGGYLSRTKYLSPRGEGPVSWWKSSRGGTVPDGTVLADQHGSTVLAYYISGKIGSLQVVVLVVIIVLVVLVVVPPVFVAMVFVVAHLMVHHSLSPVLLVAAILRVSVVVFVSVVVVGATLSRPVVVPFLTGAAHSVVRQSQVFYYPVVHAVQRVILQKQVFSRLQLLLELAAVDQVGKDEGLIPLVGYAPAVHLLHVEYYGVVRVNEVVADVGPLEALHADVLRGVQGALHRQHVAGGERGDRARRLVPFDHDGLAVVVLFPVIIIKLAKEHHQILARLGGVGVFLVQKVQHEHGQQKRTAAPPRTSRGGPWSAGKPC